MVDQSGDKPRPLTEREAATLDLMLAVDDSRLDPLRQQANAVTATRGCTCGCATINFDVDRALASHAVGLCSPVTLAWRRVPFDTDEFCNVILFIKDGWLSSLELGWLETPIPEFPPASEFEPAEMQC